MTLVRVLAALVALQVSGAAHVAGDLVLALQGVAHESDDCDDDQGHECPPGCPSCHCTHGFAVAIPPSGSTFLALAPPSDATPNEATHCGLAPPKPDRSRVYHPPRPSAPTA